MGTIWFTGYMPQAGLDTNLFTQLGTDTDWTKIAAGYNHMIAIKSDGSLWAMGYNAYGQLGVGDQVNRPTFTLISSDIWIAISCGINNMHALKADGTMWASGVIDDGSSSWYGLGFGDNAMRTAIEQVGSDTDWVSISSGDDHTMAIKANGTLWACGENGYNQLGGVASGSGLNFRRVESASDWAKMACAGNATIGVKTDGTIHGTGLNWSSQLGFLQDMVFVFTQEALGATNWVDVSISGGYSFALNSLGQMFASGNESSIKCMNSIGSQSQYTLLNTDTDWAKPSVYDYTSFGIKTSGALQATGNNDSLIGNGNIIDITTFEQIGTATIWTDVQTGNGWSETDFTIGLQEQGVTEYGQHRSICGGIRFGNKEIIGSRLNGTLYQIKPTVYKDNADNIRRIRRSQIVSNNNRYIIHNKIQLKFEPGVGLDGEDAPTVTLKWSDDGGSTWSEGRELSIGEYEEYAKRVIWRRLGKARNRIYEVSTTADTKLIFIEAYADVTMT